MMKKNGFTLAEVLITLAIIGVVATLTLPSLMSNTQEQQAVTGFRKAMNTLNEVAQMNAAVDGFDYSSATAATVPSTKDVYDANGILDQSIWGMMMSKAQVDVTASIAKPIPGECKDKNQILFRDGTALCYPTAAPADGLWIAYVDTNGKKAPNQASACDDANCKTKKLIKDQFIISLRGASAIPGKGTMTGNVFTEDDKDKESFASRWAMSK